MYAWCKKSESVRTEAEAAPRHLRVGKYGTLENVAALEEAGVRAYVALHESGSRPGFFAKGEFRYAKGGRLLVPGRQAA